MVRRRKTRRTLGKEPIKKSDTIIANIGQGSSITELAILQSATIRDVTGGNQSIRVSQDTSNIANVGDVCKYVNLCIEMAARATTDSLGAVTAQQGWLEWGVVYQQEAKITPSSTNLGVQTLADVLTKTFRGNVLLTGCIPIGSVQPLAQDIKIKIPPKFVKVQQSSILSLYMHYRSESSTDIRSDSHRLVASCLYKLYV